MIFLVACMALPMNIANLTLANGRTMPSLGLGTYLMDPRRQTYSSVKVALQQGYRMIDTAALYENELDVGKAIQDSGIPRKDIFLATKLHPDKEGFDPTLRAVRSQLKRLHTDYVDLYLIHAPNHKIVETWDALLAAQKAGLARSVGVSNFGVKHLEALKKLRRPMPVVNQIEMHPLVYKSRLKLVQFCKDNGILVQAYGSLYSGKKKLMQNGVLTKVAKKHGKTTAQVLLRWAIQRGFQVIPKSTRAARIAENAEVTDFELSEADLSSVESMKGKLDVYWNPLTTPVGLGRTDRGEL
mmetsp:Transcript_46532/g.99755  ORF Transcript_46532/g.99755 Transcript_46532/m.99755 type:complete len:298 (-) Transcript_46532:180-1073(-)